MNLSKHTWATAGTLLSLGALAWAFLRGNRALGRLSAGFAGAFLEAWRDARLEQRVARILARTGHAGSAEAATALGRLWGNP